MVLNFKNTIPGTFPSGTGHICIAQIMDEASLQNVTNSSGMGGVARGSSRGLDAVHLAARICSRATPRSGLAGRERLLQTDSSIQAHVSAAVNGGSTQPPRETLPLAR